MPTPTSVERPVLTVVPWPDPVIDALGFDPRSPYTEEFWLCLLGPTSTLLLRRLAGGLDESPEGFELDVAAVAAQLGVGNRSGAQSPFVRSLLRCTKFGLVAFDGETLRVRRRVPPLTRAQLQRLPEAVRQAHARWEHPAGAAPLAAERLRHRARHLALSLLQLGEDPEAAERQLHRWQVHPAMAHEATRWALERHGSDVRPQPTSDEAA